MLFRSLDSVEALKKRSPGLTKNQILVQWMRLNALLKDPHTSLYWKQDSVFPCWAFEFEEGLCLISAPKELTSFLGWRITEINGLPVDSIRKQLFPLIGSDNQSWKKHMISEFLQNPVILNGLGIIPTVDSARFTFSSDSGEIGRAHV